MPGLRSLAAATAAAPTLLVAATPAHAQDAADRRRVFQIYCSVCCTAQPGRDLIGPSLFGVVNRPSGHIPNFRYSDANRKSGLTWTVATLDRYPSAPGRVVPGTLMTFPGRKDQQRAGVMAYLATLH